jgi:hypothetical protein
MRLRIVFIKKCSVFFFFFFFLIGAPFNFLPGPTSRLIAYYALLDITIWALFGRKVKLDADLLIIGSYYCLYLLFIFIISGLFGFKDADILRGTLLIFLQGSTGGIFFTFIFKKMHIPFREIIFWMQIVLVLHSLFIIIFFISIDFKKLVFQYLPEKLGNFDFREEVFRSRGIGTSGAALSLIQSFGLMFTAYLVSTMKYKSKQLYYLLFSFGLLFASIFISGRTGLLIIPVIILYLFMVMFVKQRLLKNIIHFLILFPCMAIVFFFVLRLGVNYILGGVDPTTGQNIFDHVIKWIVGEFISSNGNIQIKTKTLQALTTRMWFLPDTWEVMIRGDPTTWSLNRIPSDVGYIRMLHGTGIIGMFLFYSFFFFFFLKIVLKTKKIEEKAMFVFFAIFLFITDFKEPFLNGISINSFFIVIFWFITIDYNAQDGEGETQ